MSFESILSQEKVEVGGVVKQVSVEEDITKKNTELKPHPNYGVAAVLNFFIPGLGHIFLGRIFLGLGLLFVTLIGYFIFIIPGIIFHFIAIADSFRKIKEVKWKHY